MRLKPGRIGKHDRVHSLDRPQTRKDSRYKRKNITMVGQRSSSRLHKLTTRMRNTVESAVMLDEDDDFVNPGTIPVCIWWLIRLRMVEMYESLGVNCRGLGFIKVRFVWFSTNLRNVRFKWVLQFGIRVYLLGKTRFVNPNLPQSVASRM